MVRKWFTVTVFALAIGGLSGTGCSFGEVYVTDPFLREVSLQEVQKHYSSLVRWSAFAKAAKYVEPELQEAFMEETFPSMKTFRFSDYESQPVELDDAGEAIVKVTYFGYSTTSPFEVEIHETQRWKRSGVTNDWRVTPTFEGFESEKGVAAAR